MKKNHYYIHHYKTLFISLIISMCLYACTTTKKEKEIVILAVNDMHSEIENFPKFAAVIDSIRAIYPDMLLFSAGDMRTGNPYNDYYPEHANLPMINLMNKVGFDVSCLGNHEFDEGREGIEYLYQNADFHIVSANVDFSKIDNIENNPYIIIENDDIKIAVVGLIETTANNMPSVHPKYLSDFAFTEPVAAFKKYEAIDNQCDVFLILSHCGYEVDSVLACKYPSVDAIIGGHTHYLIEEKFINDVLITQALNRLKYCSLIKIKLVDGKIVDKSSEVIDINNCSKENVEIRELVDYYTSNEVFATKIGYADTPFENEEELAYLMADAIRYVTESDIAVQNSRGVRIERLDQGDVIMEDIYSLDPFNNDIVGYSLSYDQIKNLLVDFMRSSSEILYSSGMSYTMDVENIATDSCVITNVELFDEEGKPLDKDRMYNFSLNTYVSESLGLEYEILMEYENSSVPMCVEYIKSHNLDYQGVKRVYLTKQ